MRPLANSGKKLRPALEQKGYVTFGSIQCPRACVSVGGLSDGKEATNSGKGWTSGEVRQLKQLAKGNTPTRVIGLKMGRSPGAVQSKASEKGVSLKPTNQSPYNRQKP